MDHRVGRAIVRLKRARILGRDILEKIPATIDHRCSREACDPHNESYYIQMGLIHPPIVDDSVYMCRYQNIHICKPELCTLYMGFANGVCPVSGRQYDYAQQTDYDEQDWRTWNSTPNIVDAPSNAPARSAKGAQKSRKERILSGKQLEQRVRNILEVLFFSDKRAQFNRKSDLELTREHERAREKYLTGCARNGQLVNLIDLIVIDNYYATREPPLVHIQMDFSVQEYYVKTIVQVWEKVWGFEHSTKVSVDMVALGTLYLMRQGLVINGVTLLPKDAFLNRRGVLPLINDITFFGFPKKRVTGGEKLIKGVYTRALENKASRETLTLDTETLPDKERGNDRFIKLGNHKERPKKRHRKKG